MTTTTNCDVCGAKSGLFLCAGCQRNLVKNLQSLAHGPVMANGQYAPGLLDNLAESALGLTRLGEVVRHTRFDHAGPRLNMRAGELLTSTRNMLGGWIRHLCESRGIDPPVIHPAAAMASWLAANVSAIACDEAGAELYNDIHAAMASIERVVDRPQPKRPCGPCPSMVDDAGRERHCAESLFADRESPTVICPACKSTHVVDDLMAALLRDVDDWHFTRHELLHVLLPVLDERIPESTFRKWEASGKLISSGHQRMDGRPTYQLRRVRELRAAKPQCGKTGAGAHRRNRKTPAC